MWPDPGFVSGRGKTCDPTSLPPAIRACGDGFSEWTIPVLAVARLTSPDRISCVAAAPAMCVAGSAPWEDCIVLVIAHGFSSVAWVGRDRAPRRKGGARNAARIALTSADSEWL